MPDNQLIIGLDSATESDGAANSGHVELVLAPTSALDIEEANEFRAATAISAYAGAISADDTVKPDTPAEPALPSDTSGSNASTSPQPAHELLFIDGSIVGYEKLIAAARDDVQVVVIDSSRDGFAQISAALAGREYIAAIHLVTHGDPGRVALDRKSTRLNSSHT